VSGLDPRRTFLDLVEEKELPDDLLTAVKFVPSSEPMNRPWNPPLLFSQRPCKSGCPSASRGNGALCALAAAAGA
jgi:hypothetical protein